MYVSNCNKMNEMLAACFNHTTFASVYISVIFITSWCAEENIYSVNEYNNQQCNGAHMDSKIVVKKSKSQISKLMKMTILIIIIKRNTCTMWA